MINITFPDSSSRKFPTGITGAEIAKSISASLAKSALAIYINDKITDLSIAIKEDASVKIITDKDPDGLEIIRHDAAHITAQAVKELFPEVQVTIGPVIKNGFYYDFARETPFTAGDLEKITVKMQNIIKRNEPIIRELWDRDAAVAMFKAAGEFYKVELINSIADNEQITLYRQGNFIDLCRGPHSPSTGRVKYFKLMKVAGAYWRGDSNNIMLQRIYGTAWASKEELDNYLHILAEAERRDHRKLGKELDLFHLQEEAPGMVFWHSKGWTIYKIIQQYIRRKLENTGYIEVKTPVMVDKYLWEASGHWEKFRENMFAVEHENKTYALKPMNCPCHVQIFKQGTKSYRDLPLRMAEFGSCYRNEASGALHGLLRVRNFVQDDAHIFCTEEQINSETINFCNLLTAVYQDFGFTAIGVKFSDRPSVRAGDDTIWDKAEDALLKAVKAAKLPYEINSGEGAFYGPKLEFVLTDAMGRQWQCGTIQVDFVLPQRLDAEYVDATGQKRRPVILHRAIIGTFERFIGILIEQYDGKFPLWLAPVQVAVIGVTNDLDDYAREVYRQLLTAGVRTELDISKEKINAKIRYFSIQKVPIIAIIGKKEQQEQTITLREIDNIKQVTLKILELIALITQENEKYLG